MNHFSTAQLNEMTKSRLKIYDSSSDIFKILDLTEDEFCKLDSNVIDKYSTEALNLPYDIAIPLFTYFIKFEPIMNIVILNGNFMKFTEKFRYAVLEPPKFLYKEEEVYSVQGPFSTAKIEKLTYLYNGVYVIEISNSKRKLEIAYNDTDNTYVVNYNNVPDFKTKILPADLFYDKLVFDRTWSSKIIKSRFDFTDEDWNAILPIFNYYKDIIQKNLNKKIVID